MKTLVQRLLELTTGFGADVKTLFAAIGTLSTLKTAAKTSIVNAINELFDRIATGASINDAASSTTSVYSSSKTDQQIATSRAALKTELLGGASAAFDTLKEIQTAIESDNTATGNLLAAVGKRVAVDNVQGFTDAEKIQGRANIGALSVLEIGNPDTDFLAAYNTAKA